ncbi:MAG: hypothetical protein K2G87_00545 [Oscillospiraceae bacterium]|nr:hypothetical protein [Oscillospiraceae bacterium]
MSEHGLAQAEQRVREMNRVTRQYAEQGNRFMQQQMLRTQNTQNAQNVQNVQNPHNNQTRFERVVPENNTYGGRQNAPKQNGAPQRPSGTPAPAPQPAPEPPAKEREPHRDPQLFGSAFQFDNEKLMILLILYLLIKEKADIKLILALGYLLL